VLLDVSTGHVAAPVAAATRWAPTAVTTILELWDRQAGAGGRAEIVEAVAAHLADLPSAAQPPLARQLIPLIAKLPFAAERADAFAKVHAFSHCGGCLATAGSAAHPSDR